MNTSFTDLKLNHLETELDRGIGWIRLARPPVNAISLSLLEELVNAIRVARFDPQVRVIALASSVAGHFSAGLDVHEFAQANATDLERLDHLYKDVLLRLMRTARKVFVAVIAGHCLGGGLELALATDFRLGVKGEWQLGLPEVRLGGMPGGGGIQLLARLVGPSRALRMALFGEMLDPVRAAEWGLLDELFDAERADEQVRAFLGHLAEGPILAQGAIKLALREGHEISLAHALVLERELYRALISSEDLKEGLQAFREKRRPAFRGR